jgi:hypothetical protein
VNVQEPERRWASLPPPLVQKDLHHAGHLNRQRLWLGMPVIIMAGCHRAKEGFIRSVTEHFEDPNSASANETCEHRCDKNCRSCTFGYAFGHACSNWCLNVCSQRALAHNILPGSTWTSIAVEVALSASFGRVQTFGVQDIRVHE